jgi:endonuclease/exonuclease/phosphatase (EEP) superfamily protein YafD
MDQKGGERRMSNVMDTLIWLIAAGVVAATVLPFTNSVRWWVRMWDFPRLHIAILALGLAVVTLFWGSFAFKIPLVICLLACGLFQLAKVFPYTKFATKEITPTQNVTKDRQITLLAANVLMENDRHQDLAGIIDREDPDVLLLMETDAVWHDALADTLAKYPTVLAHPLDNCYGLIFATRLTVVSAEIVFLADDNTPAVRAELRGPDGAGFNYIGLHPRPPVPGNDTETRDKQIRRAALAARAEDWPTIAIGDFNDVAWSWTSQRFKHHGNFLDPRVGHGMLSSFHANYWFLRVPIDQMYLTRGIGLVSFERLENFGSDHFPIKSVITL